jgi:tRNA (guanine-N7-)-methyltransferase
LVQASAAASSESVTKPTQEADQPGKPGELRSYGRRHGRKPSARQQALLREVLPRVAPRLEGAPILRATDLFPSAVEEVWVEIGFGGGEHLLWQAANHPRIGIIGCEPYQDGVLKVLQAIADGKAPNVLVHADDARPLLHRLPAGCLGRVFILFPDPWPKTRHRKRRLINAQLLDTLGRLMRPGAELRVATDVGDYARTILTAIRRHRCFRRRTSQPENWRTRPQDWPATRYEEKAIAAGRRCYYFSFERATGLEGSTNQ